MCLSNTIYDFQVGAGVVIGEVVASPCNLSSHIHLAMWRNGGPVDPTEFMQGRNVTMPEWVQECDDYKLEFKVNDVTMSKVISNVYQYNYKKA